MLGTFKNYMGYMPSRRDLRQYVDYDIDDVLAALGLERRNVGMDVLGYTAIFVGGAILGAVLAGFFVSDEIVDRARNVARDYVPEDATRGMTNA